MIAIADMQDVAEALYRMAKERKKADKPSQANGHAAAWEIPVGDGDLADDEVLLEKARRAKNGAKFSALFDHGDITDYQGDDSRADMALAMLLAYWTGRDEARMERLFSRSALGQRDKWRERADYRGWTIGNAVELCTTVYSPRRKNGGRKAKQTKPAANGDGHARENGQRIPLGVHPVDAAALAKMGLPPDAVPGDPLGLTWYFTDKGYLFCQDARGEEEKLDCLANFDARIVEHIVRHEGGVERARFKIRINPAKGGQYETVVDAEKFSDLKWIYSASADLAIGPGREIRDKLRHAIQVISGRHGIERRVEHTSLGWIEHEGRPVYLHAGGGIGSGGAEPVGVDPPESLRPYRLPTPPDDSETLTRSVEACVDLLSLGKANKAAARGMAAVIASLPWRAVLGGPFDCTAHFSGMHHSRKTSVAKLVTGHFCFGVEERFLVTTTWESSVGTLQRIVFDARDSLVLIDELTGEKAIEVATEVIQAQGNLRAGGRLTQTRGMATTFNPRGSILSTGEADPHRQSTLGRMLTNRFTKDTVDLPVLTRVQRHAVEGLFALAMSGFIRWLARDDQLERARAEYRSLVDALIQRVRSDKPSVHMRHLGAAAELAAAYRVFMRFAADEGALHEVTAIATGDTIERYLIELIDDQKDAQAEKDPAQVILSLLRAALHSGRFHLRRTDESQSVTVPPLELAEACGWKLRKFYEGPDGQMPDYEPPVGSQQIGYIDPDENLVLLDPAQTKVVVRQVSRSQGEVYENADKIPRDLAVAGISRTTPMKDGTTRHKVQRQIRGSRRWFIGIPGDLLFVEPEAG